MSDWYNRCMVRALTGYVLVVAAVLLAACQTTPIAEPLDIEATVQAVMAAASNTGPDIRATVVAEVQAVLTASAPSDVPDTQAAIEAGVQAAVEALALTLTSAPTATAMPTMTPIPTVTPSPEPTAAFTPLPTFTSTATPTPLPPTPTSTAIPNPTDTLAAVSTPTLSEIISRIEPAVVRIIAPGSSGSGFIYNEAGWVLTNAHVVGTRADVTVVMEERFEFKGKVIGVDEDVDLAVIKLESENDLPVLSFGDSNDVNIGDDVVAIGFPLGSLLGSTISVTKGVLSSKRSGGAVDYLQTDAAINPGNSGGPLVNSDGEVVGINTSRIERVLQRSVQGIGLAIASNEITALLPGLMTGAQARNDTIYENEKHWYAIDVPSGWSVDSRDSDSVSIWEPNTFSTVLISVQRIDVRKYPTIEMYTDAGWEPAPAKSWTNWRILNDGPIRDDAPVKAHEFIYKFRAGGERWMGRTRWYLLGDFRVRVDALAEEAIWNNDSSLIGQLQEMQESFEPARFVSAEHGYSLSHPIDWEVVEDQSTAYRASDSSSSALVYVEIEANEDNLSILEYGSTHTVKDSVIESSGLVFEDRPNPGYRIDYSIEPANGLEKQRGAALITLNGKNAIWVFVQSNDDEWDDLEPVLEDVLLRVAVNRP